MANRTVTQCVRILLVAALLLPLSSQAQQGNLYQVELLVFSYPAGGSAEQWEATPELAYPEVTQRLSSSREQPTTAQPTPFATLPATQREMEAKADALQRSGRYRILFHEAWLQPIASQSTALPIVLDHSGDGGQWPALQGSIKLYQSGDMHLETNLWLNTQGEYLHNSWRMPPPPLGPSSGLDEVSAQAAPDASRPAPTGPSPEYPFRHAVLLAQDRHFRSGEVLYIDHPMLGVIARITAPAEAPPAVTAPPETKPPETTPPLKPGPPTPPI